MLCHIMVWRKLRPHPSNIATARIGLAALAVCRPLPFVEVTPPTLSDVAGDLASWRGSKAEAE